MYLILLVMIVGGALGIFLASFSDWLRNDCGGGWPTISGLIVILGGGWIGYTFTLDREYEEKVYHGQVINSISDDNQVFSTAIYSENGVVKIKKLDGFIPAGVAVEVRKAKTYYGGLYFEKLEPKIELKLDNTTKPEGEGVL